MQVLESVKEKEYILVVDDTSLNLQLLLTILAREGYDGSGVTDGATALSVIKKQIPDLVLLDQYCGQIKKGDKKAIHRIRCKC
jgi:CheY-like chemotaxis protein